MPDDNDTSPSAEDLRRRQRARRAARAAREAAEGVPRPSLRGRPRIDESSAALYVLSVRLPKDQREIVQKKAKAAGVSLAEYARKLLMAEPLRTPPEFIEIPAKIDVEYAMAVTSIANNLNQLAFSYNALLKSNYRMSSEDRMVMDEMILKLSRVAELIAPDKQGAVGRLLLAARLLVGKHRELS